MSHRPQFAEAADRGSGAYATGRRGDASSPVGCWRVYNTSGSLSYLYDASGQFFGGNWAGGAGTNQFIFLGSRLLAGYTSGAHFAHVNVLGSETHMTDWAGNDPQATSTNPEGRCGAIQAGTACSRFTPR